MIAEGTGRGPYQIDLDQVTEVLIGSTWYEVGWTKYPNGRDISTFTVTGYEYVETAIDGITRQVPLPHQDSDAGKPGFGFRVADSNDVIYGPMASVVALRVLPRM